MKRFFTSLTFSMKRTVSTGMLAFLCFAFFSTVAVGQNAGAAQEIGDLSGTTWKSSVDLNEALVSERAKMDVMLAAPGLPLADRALFLSYQRLLDYLQADIQAGTPVNESLVKNFDKVVAGAPYDPDLKYLPLNGMTTLLPGLLEALTGVPAAVTAQ